jgi:murein endopeptidase
VRLALLLIVAAAIAALTACGDEEPPPPPPVVVATSTPTPLPPVATATPPPTPQPPSRAVGLPYRGRLINGRRLPLQGDGFATWDPILKRVGNRPWRRWGTERLLRTLRVTLAEYARRHPGAPPVLVGDLSRPRGGDFGPRFGGIGHASHQNGLDADVYYPRRDGVLRRARKPSQVDRAAAQELVDLFLRADPVYVFVGPSLGLTGPPKVVEPLVNHDDHLHIRLRG